MPLNNAHCLAPNPLLKQDSQSFSFLDEEPLAQGSQMTSPRYARNARNWIQNPGILAPDSEHNLNTLWTNSFVASFTQ